MVWVESASVTIEYIHGQHAKAVSKACNLVADCTILQRVQDK